ncbi:MAG: DUF4342 domain-containing protein [Firmicutes bacterium]|nr:DUF4342 domain-containing protein [Bacillota bacterium]
MDITLEKIDEIRERTGLNYKDAKELLEEAKGDVVKALIILEEEGGLDEGGEDRTGMGGMKEMMSEKIVGSVKRVFSQGTKTRIRVSNEEGTLLEFPATLMVAGALLAPRITALTTVVLLMAQYSLEADVPQYASDYSEEWPQA